MDQEVSNLKSAFLEFSNNEKALEMSRYMKGLFVFIGIQSSLRRSIQKEWIESNEIRKKPEKIRTLINKLFQQKEREFHYTAVDLLISIPKKQIVIEDNYLMETLITMNSWWDTVDLIASNFLGNYIEKYNKDGYELIEKWRNTDNIWLNRACLLAQLKFKERTDFELLKSLIIQFQPSKEFFIRKAIGWSLREYSKHNKNAVRKFIDEIQLEGLARREASKYL